MPLFFLLFGNMHGRIFYLYVFRNGRNFIDNMIRDDYCECVDKIWKSDTDCLSLILGKAFGYVKNDLDRGS